MLIALFIGSFVEAMKNHEAKRLIHSPSFDVRSFSL